MVGARDEGQSLPPGRGFYDEGFQGGAQRKPQGEPVSRQCPEEGKPMSQREPFRESSVSHGSLSPWGLGATFPARLSL